LAVWLCLPALLLALPPGQARAENCGDLRNNIAAMDAQSNALPGYLGMRVQLANVYNRLCGSSPAQRTEYWYTTDGQQLGPAYIGDRPANAAYAATPDIAAQCAGASNPKVCAFALGAFANCKAPSPDIKAACEVPGGFGDVDDRVRAEDDRLPDAQLTIGGKTYDVTNACAEALVKAGDGRRSSNVLKNCPDDLLAALGQAEGKDAGLDPTAFLNALGPLLNKGFAPPGAAPKGGFDAAFCAQMQHNADICKQRQDNMTSCVPTGNSQQPCAPQDNQNMNGQAGAFGECYALYGRYAAMCRMNVNQRPQIAAASAPKGAAPLTAKPPAPQPPKQATAQPPPPAPPKPACPAGTTPTKDGYCIGAGQNYCGGGMACSDGMECLTKGQSAGRCSPANGCLANEFSIGNGNCANNGSVVCPGGRTTCPAGAQCSADGQQCFGLAKGTERCGGFVMQPGFRCAPDGRSYDPRTTKVCGMQICNILTECGDNQCLSPIHQTAVPRQGAGQVQ
jgi:hypothetical protein